MFAEKVLKTALVGESLKAKIVKRLVTHPSEICFSEHWRDAVESSEIVQDARNEFGDKAGTIIGVLIHEISQLHMDWDCYRNLFGANEERWKLLYEVSGDFAHTLEEALWNSMVFRLLRLSEKSSSKKNIVLSLHSLESCGFEEVLMKKIRALIEKAADSAQFCKALRNKKLAHNDEHTILGKREIDFGSRDRMNSAIQAASEPIVFIYREVKNTHFEPLPIRRLPDEMSLLDTVYFGQKYLKEAEKDWKFIDHRPNWLRN